MLGGELLLHSAPGQGSRFSLRLPVQRLTTAPDMDTSTAEPSPILGYAGPRRRILVIDDNADNRRLMIALLQQLGFAVDTADGAQAALARARERAPDLVIADLRMPEVCGYAATWQLRTALGRWDLPAIAASASPLPAPEDAAALGFDAFLLKPITLDALRETLGECLGLHWQRGDAASLQSAPSPGSRPPAQPPTQPLAEPPEPPPRMELAAALELAELNDWDSLRDWCRSLDDAFPECRGFARRVHALLDQIDAGTQTDAPLEALRRLLADRG